MRNNKKTALVLFTALAVVFAGGCTKPDGPNNDGNGGSNGGGSGGENHENHEYVDLGLPSGTLWATCNVGAATPEDHGDWFAWGETAAKYEGDWDNYRFGRYPNITKYNEQDNLTTLQAEDDAATVNWGDGWYTPTPEQWMELIDYTTGWHEISLGGVRLTASNGESILLPFCSKNSPKFQYMTNSIYPYTYSSDPNPHSIHYGEWAWHFLLHFNHHWELYDFGTYEYQRCEIRCVRPVRSR